MATFRALSYGDKWRVRRCLARGESPPDRQMATAGIELAERYQREGRLYMQLMRWLPGTMIIVFGFVAIPSAVEGNKEMTILYALIVLTSIWHLVANPAVRPQNMDRALRASRQMVDPDD